MPRLPLAVRVLRAAEVDPRLAGALAFGLFFATRPRMPVARDAVGIVRDARRDSIHVDGRRVDVAHWGIDGPPLVLLHGWRGRAAQFAPLVPALRAAGYRVIAPDVPAHGSSQGGPVDVRDWLAVLAELQRRHGRFRGIIGHSFGGFAALTAARLGVETDTLVSIAGAGRPAVFIDEFSRMTGLGPATRSELERRFLARLGDTRESLELRYDAVAHPLSPAIPLLLVHGERDRQVPIAASRELAEATIGARLEVVPDAGHTRVIGHLATVDAVLAHLAIAPVEAVPTAR